LPPGDLSEVRYGTGGLSKRDGASLGVSPLGDQDGADVGAPPTFAGGAPGWVGFK
jgi:hypothetical protein